MNVCILGIGNLLWADEGFGVRCLERLQQTLAFDEDDAVELVDGGTQGLYLLPYVQQADALLIFDAIDYGLAPGTLHVVRGDEVPRFMGAKKMSLHQTGFQEVLQLAALTGHMPERLTLIGCQPEALDDYGGSLRPPVRAALAPALAAARAELLAWGVTLRERTTALPEAGELALSAYEGQRPSAEVACRLGDARFLPQQVV